MTRNLFDNRLDREFERVREQLVAGGELPESHFKIIKDAYLAYLKMIKEQPERSWPAMSLVAFIEAAQPRLMLKAWAALRDKPYQGVDDLLTETQREYGPEFFQARPLHHDVPMGLPVHETVVDMGAATREEVDRVRALRRDIQNTIGLRLFIGALLVRMGKITVGEYYQSVALHYGVPFQGVSDETMEEIATEWVRTGDLDTTTLSGFLGDLSSD